MKKTASSTILVAFYVLAACSSTTTTPTKTTDTIYGAGQTATAAISPVTPAPPEITETQKNRNDEIIQAVTKTAEEQTLNKNLPEWVAEQYASFGEKEYTKEHVAFQRSFGWGTGVYQGKQFQWFSKSNTDAWLQFNFSVKLDQKLSDIAANRKDGHGHAWEVNLDPKENSYALGAPTWMGVTNSWTDKFCTLPKYDLCDSGSVLDETVAEVNEALGLKLVVKGKFPWEPIEELNKKSKQ